MARPRLDRIPLYDPKSKAYPIRAIVGGKQPRSYSWRHVTTDQGAQGACVGHGCTQEAAARPVPVWGDPVKNPPNVANLNNIARDVYFAAQKIDPWAGGEYAGASPYYEGTSVLAGLKVGQQRGWWTSYRWALGSGAAAAAHDVILALGYAGPVIMGTYWRAAMWDADENGYLRAQGSNEGGHCYLLTSYSLKRDAVYTPNSWGGAGAGWITRADLASLLDDQGEAAVPLGRKK